MWVLHGRWTYHDCVSVLCWDFRKLVDLQCLAEAQGSAPDGLPCLVQVLMEELTSPEYTYDPGLRDQNALSYLLKRDWKKNMPHVELVNRQYCLNCYWRDLLELGTLTSDDTRVWEAQIRFYVVPTMSKACWRFQSTALAAPGLRFKAYTDIFMIFFLHPALQCSEEAGR